MEGEPNLPAPNLSAKSIQGLSSSSSPPDFLRNVQAAFKRHRPIGAMQSHNLMPRRSIQPHRDTSKPSILSSGLIVEAKKTQEVVSLNHGCLAQNLTGGMKETASSISEIQEDASITPPSISGTITNTCQDNHNPFGRKKNEEKLPSNVRDSDNVSYGVASKHVPAAEGSKKVQFALASSTISQGADDRMATGVHNLSSHMSSLALTEMEWDVAGQAEPSNVVDGESKHPMPMSIERDGGSQADGLSSSLASRISVVQDQIHLFKNFLESDSNHPMTQSSVVGSSCPTTTSVHATSAPMLNSTTHCSRSHQDSMAIGSLPDSNVNSLHVAQRDLVQRAHSSSMLSSGIKSDCAVAVTQSLNCAQSSQMHVKQIEQHHEREQNETLKDSNADHQLMEGKIEANDLPPQGASSKNSPADVKLESTNKLEKPVKAVTDKAPRKKSYDPDLFFKVNGKLYQRLGKIGSGGSSEVHKVISSDCKIYALKKIKLKGRDYATAYGFCQEILYLNKLKGKSNIIQLIDYEVTDKALLQEVMNDSINNKDSRVKDDGYIYMVLEYGEIDLAHMLSQKWKEVESSNSTIDENWLRFYWQQMLQAVNTIHEERIVHSDLKPANFLLVRGSLKLIDFGIAKAIMSDTTNIQRDAQVGTLSYMSPEAFMCNESDENGNVIKCGRPSDIWSLGCILYQMVYGRTPFSEYKTFWAKFKVITDPNHEITYAPVSHPWLLDLMKKCLAWDRNKRWRIPQLLQHPFLVPPVQELNLNAIQSIAESCSSDPEVAQSCLELRQVLGNTRPVSRDEQCRILSKISTICSQLQERIRNMD